MNVLDWITGHGREVLQIFGAAVALATLIVKLTPTLADDAVLAKVIRVLSALSLCNEDGSFITKKEE
jgi:hypothetical protein